MPLRIDRRTLPRSRAAAAVGGQTGWRWNIWNAGWLKQHCRDLPQDRKGAETRLPAFAMMFGNFITGVAIFGPAGMLAELATGLSVTIRDAGLLLTFGAIVLCFGSPLMAWIDHRYRPTKLPATTSALSRWGHAACAFAPDYKTLLVIRHRHAGRSPRSIRRRPRVRSP